MRILHQKQPLAQVDIFTNEEVMAYFPASLGNLLKSSKLESFFFLTNPAFYSEQNATLHLNQNILDLDFQKQRLKVEGKPAFPYDKLLIATGTSSQAEHPFLLPCLSTWKEFKRWQSLITTRQQLAIEGNDLESLCWVNHLVQHTSAQIWYLSKSPVLLPSILNKESSSFLEKAFQHLGGKLVLGTDFHYQKQGKGVDCRSSSGQKISCDLIWQSVQWKPNISFLPSLSKGIPVNEKMETPWPNVYAAGAVTLWQGKPTPRLFSIATEQGELAARNMTGENLSVFAWIPWNRVEWFKVPFGWFGEPNSIEKTDQVYELKEEFSLKRIILRQNRIYAGLMIGHCESLEMFYALAKNKVEMAHFSESARQNIKTFFDFPSWKIEPPVV